jgi:serine phosphatase RsbU (regulator of sigma subunit)
MIILVILIFRSYQQKKKNNQILQNKNEQISIKNAQLNQQNEEIEAQRDEIERQKEYLEYQNKEITSSINYAQRIQRAMLTSLEFFNKMFKDYFVLYKPRDIVSGDFYWASYVADKIVVTAVDCTGHGVPGAFMSMLGISFLNQIVNQDMKNSGNVDAAEILNKIRELVIQTLGHGETDDNPQEGMDMSLVVIDKNSKTINFAGAYNPLYLVRNSEIIIIDADKMPVGYHFLKKDFPFTNKYIDYQANDCLYLFSDGFADQFGGPSGKKFSPKQLREIIVKNSQLSLSEQGVFFDNIITNWIKTEQKKFKQIDDILLIGLKLSQ